MCPRTQGSGTQIGTGFFLFYCVCQVFSDYNVQRTDTTGALTIEGLTKWGAKVQEFMQVHNGNGKKGKGKGSTIFKQAMLSNEEHIKGLDHAMQLGLGWGLSRLTPAVRPVPMTKGESRFYIAFADLPEEVASSMPDRDQRCCIRSADGESTRLELVYEESPTVVVNWIDQGSCEWASRLWLSYGVGLRFIEFWDIWHRRHNNVELAFSRAGLNPIKVEMAVNMNGLQGPWSEAANYGKVRGCAEQYLRNNDHTCPIFQAVYEWIAIDGNGGVRPMHLGSEEHIKLTWESLKSNPVFTRKFDTVKMGRWHNWTQKMFRVMEYGSTLLLILIVMAVQEGWIKNVYDSPLGGGSFQRSLDVDAGLSCKPLFSTPLPNTKHYRGPQQCIQGFVNMRWCTSNMSDVFV